MLIQSHTCACNICSNLSFASNWPFRRIHHNDSHNPYLFLPLSKCTYNSHIHGRRKDFFQGGAIWTSTYGLEPTHCNRLLVEPSCWAQTVHTSSLRSYVSRDLPVTPCAECVFLFASLCAYLQHRRVLQGCFLFFLNSRCAVSVSVV